MKLILFFIFTLIISGCSNSKDECMVWVLNEDGEGFGADVFNCKELKRNCEDKNLSCEWIEDRLSGCRCVG